MFNPFKLKTRKDQAIKLKILESLNQKFIEIKIRLANQMMRGTRNWSTRRWKIFLVLFCVISTTLTAFVIMNTTAGYKSEPMISVVPIRIPNYLNRPTGVPKTYGVMIKEEEYIRLTQFDRYIDSLSHSESGRALYDSIMKYRHGLLDSIHMIEQIYLLQKK